MKSPKLKVVKTIKEIRGLRGNLKGTIGFVPTMGYLHDGHVSLINLAKKQNDHVVVSIFVNPKQFNSKNDYDTYPVNIQHDLDILKTNNVDVVFIPSIDELYPSGYETYVLVNEITKYLEGKSRPKHFTGVATIVTKFLNIIQPTSTYFGQKDAQQVEVVKKLVQDLNIPVDIIVGQTIRETDGLAMSSRNIRLSTTQRKEAPILFQSLKLAEKLFNQGETHAKIIIATMKSLIQTTSGKIDYISIADSSTLKELQIIKNEALVSIAVKFGDTRLIDNIILKKD